MSVTPHDGRGLWHRAKFHAPMACAYLAVGVNLLAGVAVVVWPETGMAPQIVALAGSATTALLVLGGVAAGTAGVHDALRDRGAGVDMISARNGSAGPHAPDRERQS